MSLLHIWDCYRRKLQAFAHFSWVKQNYYWRDGKLYNWPSNAFPQGSGLPEFSLFVTLGLFHVPTPYIVHPTSTALEVIQMARQNILFQHLVLLHFFQLLKSFFLKGQIHLTRAYGSCNLDSILFSLLLFVAAFKI